MKCNLLFALAVFATTSVGCTETQPEKSETEPVQDPSCEGASPGLGELSCLNDTPVTERGLLPNQLDTPLTLVKTTEEEVAKDRRTYTGGCTGIWYGCSRVSAEGWFYESCGSSHYVYMTFDGAYGNLVSYGIGYCWF